MKIDELLTNRHVPFQTMHHAPAFTANRMAQVLHVSGQRALAGTQFQTRRRVQKCGEWLLQ